MEKFESQKYRDDLAKEIRQEHDKEKRQEILTTAKSTGEYQEAEKLRHKVESGEVSGYSDAEKLVEQERTQDNSTPKKEEPALEKGELAPILVTVEQLIPDIKPREIVKYPPTSGRNWSDVYADRFEYLNAIFGYYGLEQNRLLKDGLKDQIVVDLGAGNMYGYATALGGGARGYVAIDKFYDLAGEYRNPERVREFVDKKWPLYCRDKELIPAAAEQDDMLSFLKRLPDNSVSIISSGHIFLFGDDGEYVMELKKEMLRVLSPSGLFIENEGISLSNDKNFVSEVWKYGTYRVFVKKEETRSKRIEEADEAFRAEVANETDIDRLRAIENQLSEVDDFRTTDNYRISIVTDRIKQLQKDQGGV